MRIDEYRDVSPAPTESQEQQRLFQWAKMQSGKYPELELMYHIPNEGKRSRITGRRMVAEGLKKGVPDICLPVARGGNHGLYIELKRTKDWKITEEQENWMRDLMGQGYEVALCIGWEKAADVIVNYLRQE